MITFLFGTTAEFVKLRPLMVRLQVRGTEYAVWSTFQQGPDLEEFLKVAGFSVDVALSPPMLGPLIRKRDVPRWGYRVIGGILRKRSDLKNQMRQDGMRSLIVVHGDTLTTVLGALASTILGTDLAHVEAGLRSGSIRSPFPEEINRRLVGHLAEIHYAPTPEDGENLSHSSGRVVVTNGNTVWDAVRESETPSTIPETRSDYGVVLLHRSEFLTSATLVDDTVAQLGHLAEHHHLIVVLDALSQKVLHPRLRPYEVSGTMRIERKMPHNQFVSLLKSASFVITDSGGVQEECAFLGRPCIVHRTRTERADGLGRYVWLTGGRPSEIPVLVSMLLEGHDRDSLASTASPSDLIVQDWESHGYIKL